MGFADALEVFGGNTAPAQSAPQESNALSGSGALRLTVHPQGSSRPVGSFKGALDILSGDVAVPEPKKPEPSVMDKLTGNGTERHQLWPERVARGLYESVKDAVTLPHDVMVEAQMPKSEMSDSDVSTMNVGRVANAAAVLSPIEKFAAPIPRSVSAPPAPTLTPGQEVAAAGQRIGVELPRAVTSDSISTQWAGKIATHIPFSGTPLRKASEKAITDLGAAAEGVQAEYGSGSIPTAGAAVREGVTNYIKNVTADRKEALYNKITEIVDPKITRELDQTAKTAQTILDRRSAAAISQPSEAVKRIEEAVTKPGGLSYEGTKTLRSYIGEMLDGRSPLPADISQSELKQIYGSLSGDLRSVAQAAGGEKALRAFERANTYTKLASQRSERLASILGAKSDEGVFDRIVAMAGSNSRADIDLLKKARKSVDPMTWDELASGVISRMGRDAEGAFSPDRFVTAYGKLRPDAKNLLFSSTGKSDTAKALDDIATVSSRIKSLNKYANPSGTGQTVAGFAELQGMWAAPLTTLGTIVSGRVLSHILAKPEAVKSVAKWSKTYEQAIAKPSIVSRAAFQQSSKLLGGSIAREVGRPDLAPALMKQLGAPYPVRPAQMNKSDSGIGTSSQISIR